MYIENVFWPEIEKRSLELIDEELEKRGITLDEQYAHIIKMCILASGDYDYADNLYFSDGALKAIRDGMKKGCHIMTDSKMSQTGINKENSDKYRNTVMCFTNAEDVIAGAAARDATNAYVAMEKALLLEKPVLFAVGHDATAILSILKLVEEKGIKPVGIIGVPAGFLNVEQCKRMLISSGLPCIVSKGTKGGSNIAAAIVNAIQQKL